jgi:hypothetical protein
VSYAALIRRNPSAGLLFVQLLGVLLHPLMESSPRGRALFGMYVALVVSRLINVAASNRRDRPPS